MSAYHSASEGVLATTCLMKLKDLCHHMYHNKIYMMGTSTKTTNTKRGSDGQTWHKAVILSFTSYSLSSIVIGIIILAERIRQHVTCYNEN